MNEILNHIALFVTLAGGLIYAAVSSSGKGPAWLAEIGRLMFVAGLVAVLFGK